MDKDNLPAQGLYVTTRPLPGQEERVPTGVLVKYRPHSERGMPMVMLPRVSENNRWLFHDRGYLVRDPAFALSLSPRSPEGFYILQRTVHITSDTIIPERTLVQLSYSRNGDPILYVGRFENNTIQFPKAGYKFAENILGFLSAAGFRAPTPQMQRQLH